MHTTVVAKSARLGIRGEAVWLAEDWFNAAG